MEIGIVSQFGAIMKKKKNCHEHFSASLCVDIGLHFSWLNI